MEAFAEYNAGCCGIFRLDSYWKFDMVWKFFDIYLLFKNLHQLPSFAFDSKKNRQNILTVKNNSNFRTRFLCQFSVNYTGPTALYRSPMHSPYLKDLIHANTPTSTKNSINQFANLLSKLTQIASHFHQHLLLHPIQLLY